MARPIKKSVDYYPHRVDHGKTMFIIEDRYGNDGYALWFKLLERLGATDGHCLDFNDATEREFFVSKTRLSEEKCFEILSLLAKLDAIDQELWKDKRIWSQNFVDGLSVVYQKRHTEIPRKPSYRTENPPIAPDTETKTGALSRESREEESKEEKSKEQPAPTSGASTSLFCTREKKKVPAELHGSYVLLTTDEFNRMCGEWGTTFTLAAISEYDARFNNKKSVVHSHKNHNVGIRDYVNRGYICAGKTPSPEKEQDQKPDYYVPPEDRARPEDYEGLFKPKSGPTVQTGPESIGEIMVGIESVQ